MNAHRAVGCRSSVGQQVPPAQGSQHDSTRTGQCHREQTQRQTGWGSGSREGTRDLYAPGWGTGRPLELVFPKHKHVLAVPLMLDTPRGVLLRGAHTYPSQSSSQRAPPEPQRSSASLSSAPRSPWQLPEGQLLAAHPKHTCGSSTWNVKDQTIKMRPGELWLWGI